MVETTPTHQQKSDLRVEEALGIDGHFAATRHVQQRLELANRNLKSRHDTQNINEQYSTHLDVKVALLVVGNGRAHVDCHAVVQRKRFPELVANTVRVGNVQTSGSIDL